MAAPTSGADLPGWARTAVCAALAGREACPLPPPPGPAAEAHAVFVTLRERGGKLRGCVGTLTPRFPTVAEETWRMAREAAFSDSRFPPVRAEELPGLTFEVSVLHPLEPVGSPADLDPRRYGIVVCSRDGRRGALLPDLEGVDTVAEQLSITRRKAGLGATEPVSLQRFRVDKYLEFGTDSGRGPR